jgi:hypothetical protein
MWPCYKTSLFLPVVLLWLVSVGQTQPASQKGVALFTPKEAAQLRLSAEEWQATSRKRALSPGPRIVIQRPQITDSTVLTWAASLAKVSSRVARVACSSKSVVLTTSRKSGAAVWPRVVMSAWPSGTA